MQTTFASLPGNKIFAGHDTGFENLAPHQLLREATDSWEAKVDLGFINLPGLLSIPYALLVNALYLFRFDGPTVGRLLFLFELLLLAFGSFALARILVRRSLPSVSPVIATVAACGASVFASYNIFSDLLLMYPASTFQIGVLIWPAVVAAALGVLWYQPTIPAGILFGLLWACATCGNPAHTILGSAMLFSIFIVNGLVTRRWHLIPVLSAVVTLVAVLSFIWLPAIGTLLLYKGSVSAYEFTDPALLEHAASFIATRTSFTNLIHFDGLIWWPKTRNAGVYAMPAMLLAATVAPFFAFLALRTRATVVRWLWAGAVLALFLAKGLHPPIPVDLVWLQTHVVFFAAFRETYDKFVLVLLLTLPPLFAITIADLAASPRLRARVAAVAGLGCVLVTAWPFLAGRTVEPYFLTTLPGDYRQVDAMLGVDDRVLSLPGAPGRIFSMSWFKGGNLENLVFRSHVVNGALFKELAISSATLYDDDAGVQAQELPRLLGAIGLYGFDHILLHKDLLTSYRMAFDYERYKVLGPLTALEMERYLDHDPRVEKQFEGPDLVLYRVKPAATLGEAYAASSATLALAYENTMLSMSDAGLTNPADHPLLLFLGNQSMPADPAAAGVSAVLLKARSGVVAPFTPETPGLYRVQEALDPKTAGALGPRFATGVPIDDVVVAQPHGDYIFGAPPPRQNVAAEFALRAPERLSPSLVVRAERVPSEVQAVWFGQDSGVAWPISSYGDEKPADDEMAEGTPPPISGAQFAPPQSRMGLNRTSVSYQIQLRGNAKTAEVAVAGTPLPKPLPLLADPHVTLTYQTGDPKVVGAWLRFVLLRRTDRKVVYLDKQLDDSGLLYDWSIRDGAQAAFDERFDDTLQLHQTDPTWVASQSFFNPEQAESYDVVGIRLLYGKLPGVDISGAPASYSVVLRSLRLALNGAPWRSFVSRASSSVFADGRPSTNLPSTTVTRRNGAVLVNAVVHEQTEGVRQPLVGRSVTFRLTDGSTLIGDVERDSADGYVVEVDPQHRRLVPRSAVSSIVATAPPRVRTYEVTLGLPPIDVMRYPEVHVRYWIGSVGIQTQISFTVRTPAGRRTLRVTSGNADAADASVPDEWVQPADFPGLDMPLILEGRPAPQPTANGWREAVFDLRDIAARATQFVAVQPIDVTVRMSMEAGPEGTTSAYAFGFGDVIFAGQELAPLHPPGDAALVLDGRRIVPNATSSADADLVTLHYPALDLGAGTHTLSTDVRTPWSVVSAALSRPKDAPPPPKLSLHRIDDELYAIHLDAPSDAWIQFAESFHPGWRLIGGPPPPNRLAWLVGFRWLFAGNPEHVVGNGFGNAWHVTGNGARDYVLDFAPQNFLLIGETISLFAVVAALALVLVVYRRRRA